MNENGPWTIGELSDLVLRVLHSSGLLEADYAGQPNGRVSSIPQERTIRWYASIGLLDKPLTMRGRTALYGRRHLCQLVAIKRLQAQGRSVAQVQEDLLGATDATLEGIAHLPKELLDASWKYEPETGRSTFTLSRRPRFWAGGEGDADSVGRGETFETVARAARIVGDSADDDSVTFEEGGEGEENGESGAEAKSEAPAAGTERWAGPGREIAAASSPAREAAGAGQSGAEAGAGASPAVARAGAETGVTPAATRAGGAVGGAGLDAGVGRGARAARRTTAAAEGAQGTESARGTEDARATAGGRGAHGTERARGAEGARGADGAEGARVAQDTRSAGGARSVGGVRSAEGAEGARVARGARSVGGAWGAQGAWGIEGAQGAESSGVVPAVRLGSGVTVLLGAATRPLNAEDLERLEEAAGPLLALLRGRGLDGPNPGGTHDEHTS